MSEPFMPKSSADRDASSDADAPVPTESPESAESADTEAPDFSAIDTPFRTPDPGARLSEDDVHSDVETDDTTAHDA
ncbi:hypothetical protein [Marisediminicola sp. LYQ134]|uniref:hypothetical protein n=1 Tax=Marisediminicola sp. LYQ134 TaxID=3391061 RepID=UPI003983BD41